MLHPLPSMPRPGARPSLSVLPSIRDLPRPYEQPRHNCADISSWGAPTAGWAAVSPMPSPPGLTSSAASSNAADDDVITPSSPGLPLGYAARPRDAGDGAPDSAVVARRKAPEERTKTHVCPLRAQYRCKKRFSTSGHAKRHVQVHTGAKDHECPECGARFSRKDNMKQHRQTHSNGGRASRRSSSTSSDVLADTEPAALRQQYCHRYVYHPTPLAETSYFNGAAQRRLSNATVPPSPLPLHQAPPATYAHPAPALPSSPWESHFSFPGSQSAFAIHPPQTAPPATNACPAAASPTSEEPPRTRPSFFDVVLSATTETPASGNASSLASPATGLDVLASAAISKR